MAVATPPAKLVLCLKTMKPQDKAAVWMFHYMLCRNVGRNNWGTGHPRTESLGRLAPLTFAYLAATLLPEGEWPERASSMETPDNEGTKQMQDGRPPMPDVLVCLSGRNVVGVACLSELCTSQVLALQNAYRLGPHTPNRISKLHRKVRQLREKLQEEQARQHRMQCRFDPVPPLPEEAFLDALEAAATRGNVLLKHFAINPIFAMLQNVILREVMR